MADLNVHSGTLNQLAAVINDVLRRLKTNASPILLAFIVVYLWREPVIRWLKRLKNNDSAAASLSSSSSISRTPPSSLTEQTATNKRQHDQELIRIRAKQQEIANQKAKEAAQKRKEKEAQERARKNKVAQTKADETETSKGTTLGRLHNNNTGSTEGTTTIGYNPMQPWSGTSRGYRPARRTARRG